MFQKFNKNYNEIVSARYEVQYCHLLRATVFQTEPLTIEVHTKTDRVNFSFRRHSLDLPWT